MERVDTLVVGGGIVGIAAARSLATAGRDVVLLERRDSLGTETSSRNSEVIHGGLYYPTGSLKARLCVAGRQRLYEYCAQAGVPHRRCGKLVVATDAAQQPGLQAIARRAAANGVGDLTWLDRDEIAGLEPDLVAHAAVCSPSTGIVDVHALMQALHRDAAAAGATTITHTAVRSVRAAPEGIAVTLDDAEIDCRALVLAAGLGLDGIDLDLPAAATPPRMRPAKGNYFTLAGRAPFSRLVYPVPDDGGLGVHLTLDLDGRARFGPDVEWLDRPDHPAHRADDIDLAVDPARGDAFYAAIRRYWPGLPDDALTPDYAGVRPKLSGPGEPAADFWIRGPAEHGHAGLVVLAGIESPGITASLAIAEMVSAALMDA